MKYIIIGHGGHGRVIRDLILSNEENEVIGFLDDKYKEIRLSGNLFIGSIRSAKHMIETFQDIKLVIAIGDNQIRKSLVEKLAIPEEYFSTIIHKSAVVSSSAKIGPGTVVMAKAVINADAEIGKYAIINTSSIVEHDCKIEDFAHICPGASLTGGVEVGTGTKVGAGVTIIPNVKVGEWSTIGAGAAVIDSLPSHCTAVGIPARVKKQVEVK